MIIKSKGKILIQGADYEVLTDFTMIIKHLYEVLTENGFTDDEAREAIAKAGRLAFMTVEDIHKEAKQKLEELFTEI